MTPDARPVSELLAFLRDAKLRGLIDRDRERLQRTAIDVVLSNWPRDRHPTIGELATGLPNDALFRRKNGEPSSGASVSSYRSRINAAIATFYRYFGRLGDWEATSGHVAPKQIPLPVIDDTVIRLRFSGSRAADLRYPPDLTATEARQLADQLVAVAEFLRTQSNAMDGQLP